MTARGGAFGGSALNPWGSVSSSFGQYSLSNTVQNIQAAEDYAVEVGWRNGTISDADYIAMLTAARDRTTVGTRDRTAAEDRLGDAVYTIGRDHIVARANAAPSNGEKVPILEELIAYDQHKLDAGTGPDSNIQQTELVNRISETQASIRSAEYADIVQRVNEGSATTQDLIDYATRAVVSSTGGPDEQDWRNTLSDLTTRRQDEITNEKFQD